MRRRLSGTVVITGGRSAFANEFPVRISVMLLTVFFTVVAAFRALAHMLRRRLPFTVRLPLLLVLPTLMPAIVQPLERASQPNFAHFPFESWYVARLGASPIFLPACADSPACGGSCTECIMHPSFAQKKIKDYQEVNQKTKTFFLTVNGNSLMTPRGAWTLSEERGQQPGNRFCSWRRCR